jgi:ribonuclease VapC
VGIEICVLPVDLSQTESAIDARKRYGGRPARLNLGDCFAYALAREKDAVLLFKGNDFLATDVKRLD